MPVSSTPSGFDKITYPFEDMPEKADIKQVSEGVYWIRMPLFIELDHINLWLLDDGDGWVLVDTSIYTQEMEEVWGDLIERFCQDKPIKKVICTHMHPDHAGMAGWLVERFGGELLMTQLEYFVCRVLAADTGVSAPPEGINFYKQHAMSDCFIEAYKEKFGDFGKLIYRMPQTYKRITDGDILHIGSHHWEVVVGSGHSPEHACLYCAELELFISGDQVLPKISSHVGIFPTEPEADSLSDWLVSCKQLMHRVPVHVLVLPAHNTPFYGLHVRLQALIDKHEASMKRVLNILDVLRNASYAEFFSCLFRRKIKDSNHGLALSEILSHLNCLIKRGLVERYQDENGILWYRAI